MQSKNINSISMGIPQLRVAVSRWIDGSNNFSSFQGNGNVAAGIRLRWIGLSQLFFSASEKFFIYRAKILQKLPEFKSGHIVGSLQTIFSVLSEWSNPIAVPGSQTSFVVGNLPSEVADAVSIDFSSANLPVLISLYDVSGRLIVVSEITEAGFFYYEIPGIKRIELSREIRLKHVSILVGRNRLADGMDANFEPIAEIHPRRWVSESYSVAVSRHNEIARGLELPLSELEWSELQQRGRRVYAAVDSMEEPDPADLSYLMAVSLDWYVSVMMGWAYLDGQRFKENGDLIAELPHISACDSQIYSYAIGPEDLNAEGFGDSFLSYIRAELMSNPTSVLASIVNQPQGSLSRVSSIDEFDSVLKDPVSAKDEAKHEWVLQADIRFDFSYRGNSGQVIYAVPISTLDATFPKLPLSTPVHCVGDVLPFRVDGLTTRMQWPVRKELQSIHEKVGAQFFVKDIWSRFGDACITELSVVDFSLDREPPSLEVVAIKSLTFEAAIKFYREPEWRANLIELQADANVECLMLLDSPQILKCVAEPPSRGSNGNWRSEITPLLHLDEVEGFVGGNIEVGQYFSKIINFEEENGRLYCTFQGRGNGLDDVIFFGRSDATLIESHKSTRLWRTLGDLIPVDKVTREISKYSSNLPIGEVFSREEIRHSRDFGFGARLTGKIGDKIVRGPIVGPFFGKYLHPAPLAPVFPVSVQELAVDFYGRTIVRIKAENTSEFDDGLKADAVWLQKLDGLEQERLGSFQPQVPFERRVIFQLLSEMSSLEEGTRVQLGYRYIRPADGASSSLTKVPHFTRKSDQIK